MPQLKPSSSRNATNDARASYEVCIKALDKRVESYDNIKQIVNLVKRPKWIVREMLAQRAGINQRSKDVAFFNACAMARV